MQNATTNDGLGMHSLNMVLVVEKETVFSQLYQMQWFRHQPSTLIVTAKGYPDFATRRFL